MENVDDQLVFFSAQVQGIQAYIFQTNKLTEIAGRSQEIGIRMGTLAETLPPGSKVIRKNAGILAALIPEDLALSYFETNSTLIADLPFGLTINQSMQKVSGDLGQDLYELTKNLEAARPFTNHLHPVPGMGQKIEVGQPRLGKATGKKEKRYTLETDKLTNEKMNRLMAVVHIDGNAMGYQVAQVLKKNNQASLWEFSEKIENAGIDALEHAEAIVFQNLPKPWPARLIFRGGDDLAYIIRPDLAFEFIKTYQQAFHQNSGISTYAGVTFVKSHYPFSAAMRLAEDLCAYGKQLIKKCQEDLESLPNGISLYRHKYGYYDGDLHSLQYRERRYDNQKDNENAIITFPICALVDQECGNLPLWSEAETLAHKLKDQKESLSRLRRWFSAMEDEPWRACKIWERQGKSLESFRNKAENDLNMNYWHSAIHEIYTMGQIFTMAKS